MEKMKGWVCVGRGCRKDGKLQNKNLKGMTVQKSCSMEAIGFSLKCC